MSRQNVRPLTIFRSRAYWFVLGLLTGCGATFLALDAVLGSSWMR